MSSPQVENGYTKIANELMVEIAKIRIPGEAGQVIWFILRQTYGWNKKADNIALSQFSDATGIPKHRICRAIDKLRDMNLIIVTQKGNEIAKEYRFNKVYATWKALPKKVTLPKKVMRVTQKGNNRYPKRIPQKKKETITKERVRNFPKEISDLYDFFFSTLSEDELKVYKPKTDSAKFECYDALDKCHRIDGYEYWQIKDVIEHYRAEDEFWMDKFYTPKKLREKNKKTGAVRIDEWYLKIKHLLEAPKYAQSR